jgi:uncharacterized protein YqfA (UPF0365 family)
MQPTEIESLSFNTWIFLLRQERNTNVRKETQMETEITPLYAWTLDNVVLYGGLATLLLVVVVATFVLSRYGVLWFQAYMSSADVKLLSMIGMSLRKINPATIIHAKIMARQAGLNIDRVHGISTAHLETHLLAGGDVTNVVIALVAADRAGIDLDFDRAAAINLAGRDVLDAVRTSVNPIVIDCPEASPNGRMTLSAVAKNGVEMRIRVRVTVRMNLSQLIGGATESTISRERIRHRPFRWS